MEIHKPNPVHSWRELLSEVGVVVIGIVIALSGEQLVEAFHHAHERHELRQALDHDSRKAVGDSKSSIAMTDNFSAWQIGLIDQARPARGARRPPSAPAKFHLSSFDVPDDPAFQAASSSGRLSLLTPEEISAYSEAHVVTEQAKGAYDRLNRAGLALRLFRFRFRQPDGSVDFSNATPAEVDQYFGLLIEALGATSAYRSDAMNMWGLREALLRGERDLPALSKAETLHYSPIAAMDMN